MSAVTVLVKGKPPATAHYDQVHDSGVARLILNDPVPAGEATLVFDYDAPFGTSLDGLYKVVDRGDSYAFHPVRIDQHGTCLPLVRRAGVQDAVRDDCGDRAARPARDWQHTDFSAKPSGAKGFTETTFEATYPLPTYLVALAVGPLDVVDGGVAPPNKYRSKRCIRA